MSKSGRHEYFSVGNAARVAYPEDGLCIFTGEAPTDNPDGSRNFSLRAPAVYISSIICERNVVAETMAEVLNENAHRFYPSAAAEGDPRWQLLLMETAPRDGKPFLAYGVHTHSPEDAQRGVKAGDHWWAIILWDVWRYKEDGGQTWVFAKDGKPVWSTPTHWMPLPEPPLLEDVK